ncbi:MAG: LPS export ABC transporter periplasmic protein LptC [Campylobacterota bacterium]|nr:LPS export ABC transporter periplasmic protein LptC [Campylobacterota bacterium]
MALNINLFFLIIIAILLLIFTQFKPLHVKEQSSKELSMIDIFEINIFKIDKNGVNTFLSGDVAKQYSDRYVVSNLKYTKNSTPKKQHLKAKFASYSKPLLKLKKDVLYSRDDNLKFLSQEAIYNEIDETLTTQNDFKVTKDDSWAKGKKLHYNNKKETISAKNFSANYNMENTK